MADDDITSGTRPGRRIGVARPRALAPVLIGLALAGCVATSPSQPIGRDPSDPAVAEAGRKITGRTFFSGSEGNLKGSIYFAPNRQALQVAPERGIQRLNWGIVRDVDGLAGPAVCIGGDYRNIAPAGTVTLQQNGMTALCAPVSAFSRIRSSQGNPLGLGTIIQ